MLEKIKRCIREGKWRMSYHAIKRCDSRGIEVEDVLTAICAGEVIEHYPENARGESCLILGKARDGTALHIVCAVDNEGRAVIITAYRPTEPKWLNERTRRGKDGRQK
ncbi:DUF4258 domain-containing protein [Desulfovirgula thermocuniculi]|uniref:DUF4258 domain-containing protein n=1 Tax=Desulfovirgula thermocuniculi TaxID=348842 RepID=UPI00040E7F57|nr:DUF4258 domain-containing protein [Desulfovirgula thermocuniculi]